MWAKLEASLGVVDSRAPTLTPCGRGLLLAGIRSARGTARAARGDNIRAPIRNHGDLGRPEAEVLLGHLHRNSP